MTSPNEQAQSNTAIVILAAGGSTRMGTPKQLLRFEGRTLLRRAVETALATTCRPVVVVLGANADRMRQELQGLDVAAIENPDWQTGMAGSLRAGIEALAEGTGNMSASGRPEQGTETVPTVPCSLFPVPCSCLVMLCDQPFVTSTLLESLVNAWRTSGKLVVCCEYAGEAGVPALFDGSLFGELCSLQGAAGAKQIFARHTDDTLRVPFAAGAFDVDTPQEYEALMRQTPPKPAQNG